MVVIVVSPQFQFKHHKEVAMGHHCVMALNKFSVKPISFVLSSFVIGQAILDLTFRCGYDIG